MPQLDFTTYPAQLFWLLVIFFLLWGLMTYVGLRPLQALFKKRHNALTALLTEAQKIQQKAHRLEKESAEKLQATRLACEQSLQEQVLTLHTTLKNAKKAAALETHKYLKEVDKKMVMIKHEALEDSQLLMPELQDVLLNRLREIYREKGEENGLFS